MRTNRRSRPSRRAAELAAVTPRSASPRDARHARLGLLLTSAAMDDAQPGSAALRDPERRRLSGQRARLRVEALERRVRLTASVSRLLETTPEALGECTPMVLTRLATLLVPALADLVRIDLVREDGTLEPAAVVHDGTWLGWIPDGAPALVEHVARGGRSVLVANLAGCGEAGAGLPGGLRDLACVPLQARGQVLGVLTLATVGAAHGLDGDDVRLAEEIARAAAVALDNARLFVQAREEARCREQALAAVSHEMRGPLQVISIASGALLRAWPADAALLPERRQIAVIAQSAERLRRLAADLLDLSRVDAGHFAVAPEPVRAGALLQGAIEANRSIAEQKGVALSASSSPALAVLADEQRVQQVFANLIGNAVRFTPAGGAVTLSAESAEGGVRFSVTDTGAGIAPQHLPRVFERFWSAGKCRDCAGLGLAISRAIVEAHGGGIGVESQPGQGATFTFTLPLAAA